MAVLVLKNADFSANYVKKIEIFGGFSETTKAVFNRCGMVEDESNLMQLSVDTFINSIVNAGLWGTKIKSLCIPFLSEMGANGNLSKAQLNIVNGENFFTSDILGSLILDSHGLKAVEDASVKSVQTTPYINSKDDFHIAGYNMTQEPIEPSSGSVQAKFIFGGSWILGLQKQRQSGLGNTPAFYLSSGNTIYGDSNYKQASCLEIGTIKDGSVTISVNGQFSSSSDTSTYGSTVSNLRFGVYSQSTYTDGSSNNTYYSKASYGLLSLGTGLTQDEMTTYTNAVNDLMAAVNTYFV